MAMGLCLIPSTLMGADPAVIQPPPSTPHHFLDAQNIGLLSLNAIIMAADIATTRRALQVPGTYEANPLMKSQGAAIAMKAATVGAGMGIAYMLHKSGHHKAERIVPLFMGVPSAIAAAHNAGIHP
jgi:hypothetical protein